MRSYRWSLKILLGTNFYKQMSIFTWANRLIKDFDWKDIAATKLSVAFFILAIAKLWPGILGLEWYWYGILFVAFAIKPFAKMFKQGKNPTPAQIQG